MPFHAGRGAAGFPRGPGSYRKSNGALASLAVIAQAAVAKSPAMVLEVVHPLARADSWGSPFSSSSFRFKIAGQVRLAVANNCPWRQSLRSAVGEDDPAMFIPHVSESDSFNRYVF